MVLIEDVIFYRLGPGDCGSLLLLDSSNSSPTKAIGVFVSCCKRYPHIHQALILSENLRLFEEAHLKVSNIKLAKEERHISRQNGYSNEQRDSGYSTSTPRSSSASYS